MKLKFTFILLLLLPVMAQAQDVPIGNWQSLLPYNTAVGLATDGSTIFTACSQAFFTYNPGSGAMQTYSKVNGMSDIGMAAIGYDGATSTTVLGYSDGNIDLFKDNTFYNIPDYYQMVVAGAKTINEVYTDNSGFAYLSTPAGIIEIDLAGQAISNIYKIVTGTISNAVTSFTIYHDTFYAATPAGVFRVAANDPRISEANEWQFFDVENGVKKILNVDSRMFFSNGHSLFVKIDDTLQVIYTTGRTIQHIDDCNNILVMGEGTAALAIVKRMDLNFNFLDSFNCYSNCPSAQAVGLADSSLWIAVVNGGLKKRTGPNLTQFYIPPGPSSPWSFDIAANNGSVWIAHGGYDTKYFAYFSYDGMSHYQQSDGTWTLYKQYQYAPFNNITDIASLVLDPVSGNLYAGSYLDGLFTLHPGGAYSLVNEASALPGSIAYAGGHNIVSMQADSHDNLWISCMFADSQICVKTADSAWYKFGIHGAEGGPMVIDDLGQIWFVSDLSGGVYVYNTNNTLGDLSDDTSYYLLQGAGHGNLPSNTVNCIARDKNNKIWIGTDNGIGIVTNCSAPFSHVPPCDAVLPVVSGSNGATGNLFLGYNVTSIAVDAADRKWVGTDDGLWLLSPDGSQMLASFNTGNCPLPSNNIMKIVIDNGNGDVYVGTDQGLMSYRSTVTEGAQNNAGVEIFPNPVRSNYSGQIAIKGLVSNSDVRITDISGALVYKTTSTGGQAVWNGRDYLGHRPQSGVYIVLVSSPDGKQKFTGKIVFIQ